MALPLPTIFLLKTHLQPRELHKLEESIPTLTYDANEAEVVLGRVSRKQRAQFELRRLKIETEPIEKSAEDRDSVTVGESDGQSSKRQNLGSPEPTFRDRSLVRVLNLSWLTESMEKGTLMPMSGYIVYEGRKTGRAVSRVGNEEAISEKRTDGDILKRAAEDMVESGSQPTSHYKRKRETHLPLNAQAKPSLTRQSTSEHDMSLPPIPEFLHTTYSCQRPTPVNPPNAAFIEELKNIRTLRLLLGDKIGVRAYSTSISSIAAYPFKIRSAQGNVLNSTSTVDSKR